MEPPFSLPTIDNLVPLINALEKSDNAAILPHLIALRLLLSSDEVETAASQKLLVDTLFKSSIPTLLVDITQSPSIHSDNTANTDLVLSEGISCLLHLAVQSAVVYSGVKIDYSDAPHPFLHDIILPLLVSLLHIEKGSLLEPQRPPNPLQLDIISVLDKIAATSFGCRSYLQHNDGAHEAILKYILEYVPIPQFGLSADHDFAPFPSTVVPILPTFTSLLSSLAKLNPCTITHPSTSVYSTTRNLMGTLFLAFHNLEDDESFNKCLFFIANWEPNTSDPCFQMESNLQDMARFVEKFLREGGGESPNPTGSLARAAAILEAMVHVLHRLRVKYQPNEYAINFFMGNLRLACERSSSERIREAFKSLELRNNDTPSVSSSVAESVTRKFREAIPLLDSSSRANKMSGLTMVHCHEIEAVSQKTIDGQEGVLVLAEAIEETDILAHILPITFSGEYDDDLELLYAAHLALEALDSYKHKEVITALADRVSRSNNFQTIVFIISTNAFSRNSLESIDLFMTAIKPTMHNILQAPRLDSSALATIKAFLEHVQPSKPFIAQLSVDQVNTIKDTVAQLPSLPEERTSLQETWESVLWFYLQQRVTPVDAEAVGGPPGFRRRLAAFGRKVADRAELSLFHGGTIITRLFGMR